MYNELVFRSATTKTIQGLSLTVSESSGEQCSVLCTSFGEGIEPFVISTMIGIHQSIPYIKIETIIAVKLFMVLVVVG